MMEALITRSDIAKYKQLSKTPNDDKLNEMILDAQLLDVQPLLGEKLFNALMASPESYSDLLEGGTYEHNGTNYTNYGLKMVLTYFTYARYMMFSSVTDTPFSVVEKISKDTSKPIESTTKKTIYQLNRESAFKIWGNVENWLVRTGNNEYKKYCGKNTNRGMRFSKII